MGSLFFFQALKFTGSGRMLRSLPRIDGDNSKEMGLSCNWTQDIFQSDMHHCLIREQCWNFAWILPLFDDSYCFFRYFKVVRFISFIVMRCMAFLTKASLKKYIRLGLITVFDAILTGRQSCQKLQCLYGNPIANNFFQNWIFQNFWIATLKYKV